MHGKVILSEYSIPLLWLWARMIATGHHDDFSLKHELQLLQKRDNKQGYDSLCVLTGVTEVFAQAVTSNVGM